MDHIYIESGNGETNIAIVKGNELVEYLIEKKGNKKTLGNIYRGRVENVLKGMQAAFVDIGEGKNAYLHLTDALSEEEKAKGKEYSIDEILKVGDEIIVQVTKESIGSKGAKISTNYILTGRYIILTSSKNGIRFSRGIRKKEGIARLESIGKEILKDDIGLIFRAGSKNIGKDIILDEYRSLLNIYKAIESERNFLPTPKLLFKGEDLIYKVIRENFKEGNYNIIVNNKKTYKEVKELGLSLNLNIKDYLTLREDLNFKYNTVIQRGLKIALSREVSLESGGSIVIDQVEALTVIDVNTHKHIGTNSLQETILETNLEAVGEIAKQIKLRNIGGIIIIDFIDLRNSRDVKKMIGALKVAFSKDKNKPHLVGITKLGLVEVTRKKERASLSSDILHKCPTCKGSGKLKKIY